MAKVKLKNWPGKQGQVSRIMARQERFQLPKGLTRDQAVKACAGKYKHDHRGFAYDPKTGKAVAT